MWSLCVCEFSVCIMTCHRTESDPTIFIICENANLLLDNTLIVPIGILAVSLSFQS